jgi:hypothetical protein
MSARKTMTLNLTDTEMGVLERLCAKKDINKTTLLRQALRLYQAIDARAERGDRLFFENELSKEKAEVVLL